MRERLMIVFVAVIIGLIVTTLVFFLYQQTKSIQRQETSRSNSNPTQEQKKTSYLNVESPQNEMLSERRLIQVKGTTRVEDLIVVSTNQEDVVARPTSDGRFSVSVTIDAGANIITTRSIAPSGEALQDTRVITYSTDEF